MRSLDFNVALVSMPWPILNRPSIQLGALKSFLKADENINVQTFHPYLEVAKLIGPDAYHFISLESWVSEALYGAVLFPEKRDNARALVHKELKNRSNKFNFDTVCQQLEEHINQWIERNDWSAFQLVGFSVCFNQLISSLTAASFFKKKYPDLPIVFGGSSCIPEMAPGLFDHFSIDYMIGGEGENPLFHLCQMLQGKVAEMAPGIYSRGEKINYECISVNQVDLDQLTLPDFDDYFSEMKAFYPEQPFIPTIPIEFSRGCWWGKCVFCNLNLQWKGYRSKTATTMIEEVKGLTQKYGSLDFTFTDNVLPYKDGRLFFEKCRVLKKDYSFFGEIRANQRGTYLQTCKTGGLDSIQVGIEAFSETLLKRLKKGVSVIENIAIMRDAAAYGVTLDGNLIIDFPGSTVKEVEETLNVLDFVLPYHPLTTASFFLGHGSPVDYDCTQYGITAVMPHANMKKIFPEEILADLSCLVKGYRGDRQHQRTMWNPVKKKVKRWQEFHAKQEKSCRPLLSMRDGGDFLLIRQVMENGKVLHHRLRGVSRSVYLACCEINTLGNIEQQFETLSEMAIVSFLNDLVNKKIMFSQDHKYLALAISTHR
jgi:ribosomal peptide maturation radical SAM protein 1